VARTEARLAAESATHRAKLEARAKVMKKRVDAVTKQIGENPYDDEHQA
jgi:hypothetical protein